MSNDDLGTRLSGSLHDHVDRAATGHVSVYDVQQRAGRIRRTRRIVAVAAAAAVAAVVVPTALLVSAPGGDETPAPVASNSASPMATGPADVTLPPDPQPDEKPRIKVRDNSYQHFVQFGSLFLGVRADDDGNRVLDIVDGQGRSSVTWPGVDQVVVSQSGTTAAWTEPDGSVWTAWDGGRLELDQQSGGARAVAVVGDGSCRPADGDGCTVYLDAVGEGAPRFVSSDGRTGEVTPDAISLGDVHGSLAATQTSYTQGRACSEVYDLAAGKALWKTCDYALLRFSPDGRHLMATTSDSDGQGPTSITVLQATTGDPVATYRVEDGFLGAETWEDDDHLLFVRYSYGPGSWDVVRADLGGAVGRAAGPVAAPEDGRPYSLAGNP